MAKGKRGSKEKPVTLKEQEELTTVDAGRSFKIIAASIKDDLCFYTFQITKGINMGDTHDVDGRGIVTDDLLNALSKLRVHLAYADDAFKNAGVAIDDIDKFHGHDITGRYYVTGIKVKGSEPETVTLIGNKYYQVVGGRAPIAPPKIVLDGLSSYQWYNELQTAIDKVREEVALYAEGKVKLTDEEKDEKAKKKAVQLKIAPDQTVEKQEVVKGDEGVEGDEEDRVEQLDEVDHEFDEHLESGTV